MIRYARWAVRTDEFRHDYLGLNPYWTAPSLAVTLSYKYGAPFWDAYMKGLDWGSLALTARDESGARLDDILSRFRSKECAGATVSIAGYGADKYGETLYAGNVSGIFGILGGRLAFSIGLAIDASEGNLKGGLLDLAAVFTGWVPGLGDYVAGFQITNASADCLAVP